MPTYDMLKVRSMGPVSIERLRRINTGPLTTRWVILPIQPVGAGRTKFSEDYNVVSIINNYQNIADDYSVNGQVVKHGMFLKG
jgi:hypothetical protein